MYFLGVDGGGTKTAFIIIDEQGNILAETTKATSHYKQTSFENFKEVIISGIYEVCAAVKITADELDFSFLGIPGYGEINADVKVLDNIVREILGKDKFKCGNDSEVAWAGSLACQPGINIVAGTGSIGFGFDSKNNVDRAGGWGDLLGDEGSAYWITLKLLENFAKQSDNRNKKTALYDVVRSELELDDDFDVLDIVLNRYERKRDKVASLAILAHKAAEKNDSVALKIYEDAAYEHFLTIKAIVEKMDFTDSNEILVSYSGGVFNAGHYILDPLNKFINEYRNDIQLIKPMLNPTSGAALYALKLFDDINDEIVVNLQNQEK